MRSTKVVAEIKTDLENLKTKLKLSSESEVITYLVLHYRSTWESITLLEDDIYRGVIKKLHK